MTQIRGKLPNREQNKQFTIFQSSKLLDRKASSEIVKLLLLSTKWSETSGFNLLLTISLLLSNIFKYLLVMNTLYSSFPQIKANLKVKINLIS